MQSVEIHGLRQVQEAFERLPEAVRRAKAEVFEAVGEYLLEDVQSRIGGSGRVAGAQEYRVGSGKGYVAVRAKKETWLDGAAAGYVTNALENGHVQTPGRYVPALGARLRRDRVPSKYMYQITGRREGPRMAEEAARRIERAVQQELEK